MSVPKVLKDAKAPTNLVPLIFVVRLCAWSFAPHRSRHLRQLRQNRGILQPSFVIDGRSAADNRARAHTARHAALRGDDGIVANLAMSDHANLSCKNHAVA